jgi:glutamate-5-semialdehyde dehydrogenase
MSGKKVSPDEIRNRLLQMGEMAKIASRELTRMGESEKNACLVAMADALERSEGEILEANRTDLDAGIKTGLSEAMLDRLRLDGKRIRAMADGLRDVASLEDPVGHVLSTTIRPNGLKIEKVSVPIGVIGIVYESRPNVTVDAAGLCFKAGNAVILRGGKESIHSNLVLAHTLSIAGMNAGMPEGAIQLIPWTDREAVNQMLRMDSYIHLIIPRGGEGLIRAVVEQSTIPVIKHYKGVCHLYVDRDADPESAIRIAINAKCQRPGVCNAIETLLIDERIAPDFAPRIAKALLEQGVELRGDDKFCRLVPESNAASEQDWYEEYLDLILAVRIVRDVEDAIVHINRYGSGHSDAIVSEDPATAQRFLDGVDSATVYVNASTRFTDGGQFGMGAEIGISTDRLHARGPMGLPELTTYKYCIYGEGQIRE